MPRTSRGRSNPVVEKELEYEIYGWFRFEDDAEDVKRLGRRWVPVAMLCHSGRRRRQRRSAASATSTARARHPSPAASLPCCTPRRTT